MFWPTDNDLPDTFPVRHKPIKNIVVQLEDGVVQGVFCPNDEFNYEIHILNNDDDSVDSATVQNYFDDVAQIIPNLVNCY